MSQIIKVSKEGVNAITGTAPDDLIYSSDYNTLKYYISGTINVTVAGTTAEGTVAHNLGYVPFFVAEVNYFVSGVDPNLFSMCPGTFADAGFFEYANVYAGTANLYFKVETNSANQTHTFRYFIFRNNTGL